MQLDMISRREAHAKGLSKFFTGRPCKFGHISQRYVSTGNCIACNRQFSAGVKRMRAEISTYQYVIHADDEPTVRALVEALGAQRGVVQPHAVVPVERGARPADGLSPAAADMLAAAAHGPPQGMVDKATFSELLLRHLIDDYGMLTVEGRQSLVILAEKKAC